MLRQFALSGCLFIAGCAPVRTEPLPASYSHGSLGALSGMEELSVAYILKGECPNWNMALEMARNKMGCTTGSNPPSRNCQELLPCDICQFLREGAWPEAVIADFPGQAYYGRRPHILAAVIADKRWGVICPFDDQTRVEFKVSLCFEKEVLGRDRVEFLAKAMIHEALHLCQYVGGIGSATVDKSIGDHLYCALLHGTYAPDAAGVTERCWESRE
jgi:hypothetical protein